MTGSGDGPELLLGKSTPPVDRYAPELLYPIARREGRERLGLPDPVPFHGADLWHAYELSWLDSHGMPASRVARFVFPASSPAIVESKSLKLYLNSLNNHCVPSEVALQEMLARDLAAACGAAVQVALVAPDDPSLSGSRLSGRCMDTAAPDAVADEPDAALIRAGDEVVEERLYSHLLRSLCPVTGQPDWASVWLQYRGPVLQRGALLGYLLSFRRHREFHEQCVERMFRDIMASAAPEELTIQAFYTRRGGLDINPLRSTDARAAPLPRLDRQ